MDISEKIDKKFAEYPDWRGDLCKQLRSTILETEDTITEQWKWNTVVWEKNGMICAIGAFKDHVRLNFFKGALLADEDNVFNSGLDAKQSRAIDYYEGDQYDPLLLQKLVQEAIAFNKNQ